VRQQIAGVVGGVKESSEYNRVALVTFSGRPGWRHS
jgi:hypothetical protein